MTADREAAIRVAWMGVERIAELEADLAAAREEFRDAVATYENLLAAAHGREEKLREALRQAPVPLVGSTTPEYIEWFRNKRRAALSEGEG